MLPLLFAHTLLGGHAGLAAGGRGLAATGPTHAVHAAIPAHAAAHVAIPAHAATPGHAAAAPAHTAHLAIHTAVAAPVHAAHVIGAKRGF